MSRMRGWGLLLVLCVPLLIYFSWSRLGSEKLRINLERYENLTAGGSVAALPPLVQHFLKHRKLALAGDFVMPAVPANSGIKAWSIQPDATLLVVLDAKADGRAVQLRYVPVVRSATGVFYDCVSTTSAVHVGRFCYAEVIRSEADIPAQLAENARVLQSLPAVVSTSGVELQAGSALGSVVAVPDKPAELDHCGFQCVKPQSCVTPRPLACSKIVAEGNARRFEMVPTATDYSGSRFPTRSAADKACEQSLGEGYRVLRASGMSGAIKLAGGTEYWVHNDVRAESNCWEADYR